MTEIGDSLVRGAKEALEISKGKLEPAGLFAPSEETEAECAADASYRATVHQVPSLKQNSQNRSKA
ncbi:hypothetical protein [Ruegeria jejuensis]|uniref:hypothetical protein n=1 Tax=Ruegeria jejuensis TaxID=3233338 RepID=UPI00355C1F05